MDNNKIQNLSMNDFTKIEFNQSIIDEQNEEIKQICKDLVDINDIFKDLNNMIKLQDHSVNRIEKQIDESVIKTEKGINELNHANKYHNEWITTKNKLLLLSALTLTINIPIAVSIGIKVGIISSLATFAIGTTSSIITKKN